MSVDLLPLPFRECLTEQAPMFLQDLCVSAISEALEERGGPLDVGEEEGYGPGRLASILGLVVGQERVTLIGDDVRRNVGGSLSPSVSRGGTPTPNAAAPQASVP